MNSTISTFVKATIRSTALQFASGLVITGVEKIVNHKSSKKKKSDDDVIRISAYDIIQAAKPVNNQK